MVNNKAESLIVGVWQGRSMVCMYIHTHIHIFPHIHTYTCINISIFAYIHTYIHTYICESVSGEREGKRVRKTETHQNNLNVIAL